MKICDTWHYSSICGGIHFAPLFFQEADGAARDGSNRRIEIPVNEKIYGGMTRAELIKAREVEHKLSEQDIAMERTKDKKNTLESYIYDMRSKVKNFKI